MLRAADVLPPLVLPAAGSASAAERTTCPEEVESIVTTASPTWALRELSSDRTRSGISPTCSPAGRRLVASAGRSDLGRRFGPEQRSLRLLSVDGRTRRRLTAPPPGLSDELPRWHRDGRSLLFVRGQTERLSALGRTSNYYGHYGWAAETDWFRR